MNWAIKIISKTYMTKILHISWRGYDKGFYGIIQDKKLKRLKKLIDLHKNKWVKNIDK